VVKFISHPPRKINAKSVWHEESGEKLGLDKGERQDQFSLTSQLNYVHFNSLHPETGKWMDIEIGRGVKHVTTK